MHTILSTCIDTLHSIAGDTHHSASPIGLWLLLAASASATEKGTMERTRAEKVLGMPVEQAMVVVEELLSPENEDDERIFTEIDHELMNNPFDSLTIQEVLFEHDGPRAFIAEDKAGNFFLANQVDEDDYTETFLYVPVSRKRLHRIRKGDIPFRQAFTDSETGTLYQVTTDYSSEAVSEKRVKPISDTDINDDVLPDAEVFLTRDELIIEDNSWPRQNADALKTAMASWIRGANIDELHAWADRMGVPTIETPEEDIYAWLKNLPSEIDHGPLPSNSEANSWISQKTAGLIKKLPLDINEETFLVLLSAITAKTKWEHPLKEIENKGVLSGDFRHATKVLVSPPGHNVYVMETEIGQVGVHLARGSNGLDVYSVIADPKYDYRDVIRIAHHLAVQDISDDMGIPLHQLEVDASDLYKVTKTKSPSGDIKVAYLPKWETETSLKDLQNHPDLGFTGIASAISEKAGLNPVSTQAVVQQDIVAEYTATGFQASAVTQMSMMATASMPDYKDALKLEIEFNHPYAVVAIVHDDSIWTGMPVFSSWVKTPL